MQRGEVVQVAVVVVVGVVRVGVVVVVIVVTNTRGACKVALRVEFLVEEVEATVLFSCGISLCLAYVQFG